jgi:hypothetical protein
MTGRDNDGPAFPDSPGESAEQRFLVLGEGRGRDPEPLVEIQDGITPPPEERNFLRR